MTTTTTTTPRRAFVQPEDWQKAAREYGRTRGHFGRRGGWIYTADGTAMAHGWGEYASYLRTPIKDYMTRKLTAFGSFKEMVEQTAPTYRPSIYPRTWRERFLADAYDVAQERRGDVRRAYRGGLNS